MTVPSGVVRVRLTRRVPPSSDRARATASGSASAAGLSWAIWDMSSAFCVYELATVSRMLRSVSTDDAREPS